MTEFIAGIKALDQTIERSQLLSAPPTLWRAIITGPSMDLVARAFILSDASALNALDSVAEVEAAHRALRSDSGPRVFHGRAVESIIGLAGAADGEHFLDDARTVVLCKPR